VTSSVVPRRRSLSAVLASLLLAVAALFVLPASPAFAHDELVSTDPPADAVLDALPSQITFTYSADILTEDGTAVVEVTDADGTALTEGTPVVSGTDVTQTLAGSASGVVTVKWRVVSSDGHPIDGTFSFSVNAASPTPTATATPTPTETPSASATSAPATATPDATPAPTENTSDASPLPWILLVVALVIVAGAIVWLFVARGRRDSSQGGSAGTTGR
jgi:methionine-rich copper-binding protein CopC